jgi:hypothetical protein
MSDTSLFSRKLLLSRKEFSTHTDLSLRAIAASLGSSDLSRLISRIELERFTKRSRQVGAR